MVKQISNDALFLKYQPELRLKIHNQLNLKNDIALLDKFREFLGDHIPQPRLQTALLWVPGSLGDRLRESARTAISGE